MIDIDGRTVPENLAYGGRVRNLTHHSDAGGQSIGPAAGDVLLRGVGVGGGAHRGGKGQQELRAVQRILQVLRRLAVGSAKGWATLEAQTQLLGQASGCLVVLVGGGLSAHAQQIGGLGGQGSKALREGAPHVRAPGQHARGLHAGRGPRLDVVGVGDEDAVVDRGLRNGGNTVVPEAVYDPTVDGAVAAEREGTLRNGVELAGVGGDDHTAARAALEPRQASQKLRFLGQRSPHVDGVDGAAGVAGQEVRHGVHRNPTGTGGNGNNNIE